MKIIQLISLITSIIFAAGHYFLIENLGFTFGGEDVLVLAVIGWILFDKYEKYEGWSK